MFEYLIVVPSGIHTIDAGSAVVVPSDKFGKQERVVAHYESNRIGARNLRRFVEKTFHAASRAAHNYPTSAMSLLEVDSLTVVAKFDLVERRITEVTDPAALRAWAGDIGDLNY